MSTRELAAVINLFDAYAQYSNSEGLGLPQIEAAACGVPVFSTDYSAMSDVVRKVNGHPVRVAALTEDVEFGCLRALPCPEDFAAALLRLFSLPEAERQERRHAARRGVLEHYQWPQTAARWMAAFDGLPPAEPWDAPRRVFTPAPLPAADFPGNEAMVRWCLEHRLGRPDLVGTHAENALVRDINWSSRGVGRAFETFDPEKMLAEMDASRDAANAWETKRTQEQ